MEFSKSKLGNFAGLYLPGILFPYQPHSRILESMIVVATINGVIFSPLNSTLKMFCETPLNTELIVFGGIS
jgi:preprotein translocase subunit SecB